MPKPTSLPATVATDSSTETLPTRAAKDASAAGASAGIQPVGDRSTEVILRHWREAVPNDRFAHLVKDATRSFQRSLQMRLARFDVPFGHWTFLRALWERDGLTQKQLSDEVGVMEPTTLMAVRAMEARGWVQRRQRAENRKNVHVYLTDAGRALKDVLVPLAEEVNATGAKGLTTDEIAIARRVLLAMITNLAEDATGRA
ncbi:MarR family transcriptional regulator [Casimicrobium huifangae]|uniref:MarR family transcriptional regulator n=1 Tax=Casimicrobium huifangae TaxID=2591109 RepID=UPI0012EB1230